MATINSIKSEDDDPVIKEIDVYLSKGFLKNLYLLQYPVRPANFPYDDEQFVKAKVKPKQQKLEIEVAVDTYSQNYDKGKGEQIVLNTLNNEQQSTFFDGKLMDKQYLSSIKASTGGDRYAVGFLKSGELHLNSVYGMVQMKPGLSYLDVSDSATNEKQKGSDDEEEEEAKAVTVKFATPLTEKARQAKEMSFWYQQQKMAKEPWIKVNVHSNKSARSELERNNLFCKQRDHDASQLPCSITDYLERLVAVANNSVNGENKPSNSSKDTPLSDHVKAILLNAKVIRFCELQELLPLPDPLTLLRALQPLALLVQGCWVIKSELLYPKDTFSPLSRVPAETLCRVRDYVVWKFSENRYLKRTNLPESLKLPDVDWRNILSDIAELSKADRNWVFKYQFDQEFCTTYPEVVERQTMLWNARCQQMSKIADPLLSPKKQKKA